MSNKPTQKKIDLTPDLKRPMDRAHLSNDSATLRALTGMLNDPRISGAEVPPDEKNPSTTSRPAPSAQTGPGGATIPLDSIPTQEETKGAGLAGSPRTTIPPLPVGNVPSPTPAPSVSSPVRVKRLVLLTGRKAAEVADAISKVRPVALYRLYGAVGDLARYLFPGFSEEIAGAAHTLATLVAWGNNEVNDEFPVTIERIIFLKMMKSICGVIGQAVPGVDWSKFGADGFWMDQCLSNIQSSFESDTESQFILIGVLNRIEYAYVTAKGFSHWHVMSPRAPGNISNDFNSMLDNDVTKQISQHRDGQRLRCVWSELTTPISKRIWGNAEFVSLFKQ